MLIQWSQPILLFAVNDKQTMHPFCTNPPQDHLSHGQGLKEFQSKKAYMQTLTLQVVSFKS